MAVLAVLVPLLAGGADEPKTQAVQARKFGVEVRLPDDWKLVVQEREDRAFVALIPRDDPDRPGVVACELALAPESLDEYRTRIDGNARRGNRPGQLVRNEVVKAPDGSSERLETVWEFRPRPDELWIERSVRLIANRQLYTFLINADEKTYALAEPRFNALVNSAAFTPPDTGADPAKDAEGRNRWVQREFKFALDLPDGWRPALAPSEVALLYANGPAHGIWSDNCLVIARPHGDLDLSELARTLPDQLRAVEPGCEVLRCEVVKQGKAEALETIVRTQRGPFSMTVLERRFRGGRLDYEVKYTLESKRFDGLLPELRKSLDSFDEVPGTIPGIGKPA
jgi:hypothetical protein